MKHNTGGCRVTDTEKMADDRCGLCCAEIASGTESLMTLRWRRQSVERLVLVAPKRAVPGSVSSSRWIVFASSPVLSDIRFAARPVGAQIAIVGEPEINTNSAESFFSRMRRGEVGHHHHVAGPYLIRFAQESAWREDHRRDSNGAQVDRVVALVMRNKPSVDFCGYWPRAHIV